MNKLLRYISIKPNLTGKELDHEKSVDYRNIVIVQVLIISSALLLKDVLSISGINPDIAMMIRDTIFLTLAAIYVFWLWDHLRNLTHNNKLVIFIFVLVMLGYGFSLVVVNPFFKVIPDENEQRPYLFVIHLMFFIVEATVIYHSILDIFSGKKISEEKLWGSACIFLMIGLCFGSVYDLINITRPGSMGIDVKMGLDSYTYCICYSMTIIGGHDATIEAIPLIMNIGTLEAVWANLFVVLLVGKLLGQPDDEKA